MTLNAHAEVLDYRILYVWLAGEWRVGHFSPHFSPRFLEYVHVHFFTLHRVFRKSPTPRSPASVAYHSFYVAATSATSPARGDVVDTVLLRAALHSASVTVRQIHLHLLTVNASSGEKVRTGSTFAHGLEHAALFVCSDALMTLPPRSDIPDYPSIEFSGGEAMHHS